MALTLLGTISETAQRTWSEGFEDWGDEPWPEERQRSWVAHWFKTADNFLLSLEKEGLTATAEAVKLIIVDQQKIVDRFLPTT